MKRNLQQKKTSKPRDLKEKYVKWGSIFLPSSSSSAYYFNELWGFEIFEYTRWAIIITLNICQQTSSAK